jgi:glycosyltransferase involved in cell wall biosynthesis
MRLIFFAHPAFLKHQSMPRFANMLAKGMEDRGHSVRVWMPGSWFSSLPFPTTIKKWLGYLDQYIIFPLQVRMRLMRCEDDTLFVFTDQALGPWVPLVANRPHLIHCHDLLAQQSALGLLAGNQVGWTGKKYQAYIRQGFSFGKNFISVSHKTRDNLHELLNTPPVFSEVVYNGFNQPFERGDGQQARILLGQRTGIDLSRGYLMHIGGNQWYKNRAGVIRIFDAWCSLTGKQLPLLMIGPAPDLALKKQLLQANYRHQIHFLPGLEDEYIRLAYQGARALIFPSHAEGFGWPIAEAMASGCPVMTTNAAPMTEVAGNAAFFIPPCPLDHAAIRVWAESSAHTLEELLSLSPRQQRFITESGFENASRFNTEETLNKIEMIYRAIPRNFSKVKNTRIRPALSE